MRRRWAGNLLTATRKATVACSFQQHPHTDDDRPPTALGDMLNDLWHAKQQLATLLDTDTPQIRRQIHHCRVQIAHTRANLQGGCHSLGFCVAGDCGWPSGLRGW